jgi:hypothetical protein
MSLYNLAVDGSFVSPVEVHGIQREGQGYNRNWGPGSTLVAGEGRVLRAVRVAGTPPSCIPAVRPRHRDDAEGGASTKFKKKFSILYI